MRGIQIGAILDDYVLFVKSDAFKGASEHLRRPRWCPEGEIYFYAVPLYFTV